MTIIEVDDFNFDDEVLNYEGIAVAKFFGSWCGPCRMVANILEDMADDEFKGLKVVEINVDKSMTLAKQFGVMSVPTFVVFKDGAEIDKFVGFRNKNQLTELFNNYLESGK